ncbi:MAG: hypothetical protein M3Y56_05355 [Armatimonadota bacterium]|nr:hypothetical protein [Armatimonadota bacterium]
MSSFKCVIKKVGLVSAIAVTMASISVGAFAQRQRGGPQVTVSQVPVAVLDASLKLTADEKTKIGDIETKLAADTKALMPADGTPPDPQARQTMRQQTGKLRQTANTDIEALLTDDQKTAWTALAKDLSALQFAGISPAALPELALTDDVKGKIITASTAAMTDMRTKIQAANGDRTQFRQIMTDARSTSTTAANALLTDDQKATIKKYPVQMGGGGRGGRGGNGGGGAAPATPPAAQ